MTSRISTTVIFALLLFPMLALCDDSTMTCSMFRLKLKDGTATGGTSGKMVGSTFTGIDWDKKPIWVDADRILKLDSAAGSHALQVAAYGAMVGVGSAVAYHLSRTRTRNASANGSEDPFLRGALLVAGGAAVGMLIGSFFTDWDPVMRSDSNVSFSVAGTVSISLSIRF